MENEPELQQSNTLLLVNEISDALRFIKCIIPYYSNENVSLMEEVKEKISAEWSPNDELLHKELCTKYYNAKTNIYIILYDTCITTGVDETIESLSKEKMQFDSIFFFVTALGPKQILGHDKYCLVVNEFTSKFEPQIQTNIYQKNEDFEVDMNYIMKQEEELESFTESVFDDFKKLCLSDQIIKPRAKSMLEETEGITRVIDILESSVWVGSVMKVQEKKQQVEVSDSKVNIHIATYDKNKDTREKYENQLNTEKEEELALNKGQQLYKQELETPKEANHTVEQKVVQEEEVKKPENNDANNKQGIEDSEKESDQIKNEQTVKIEKIKELKVENANKEVKVEQKDKNKQTKQKENKKTIENEDEEEQESNLNDFVKILQQMKGIKETSSKLNDDQRKEQAEKFVLGLMEAFGLDEESEDDQ